LFLVSCSNVGPEYDITVNEDVDQKFAEDSIKMIQIFDKHLQTKNKPKFKDEDEDFMNKYIETYAGREVVSDRPRDPNFEMSVAEYQIYLKTSEFYGSYSPRAILLDDGTYLNGKSNFKRQKEAALDIIENGFD